MLVLEVYRTWKTDKSTIGELYVNFKRFCFTLEDVVRTQKIFGVTAVPAGTYKVKITDSKRFKKPMPEIMNVPGYAGIRIHVLNTAEETEGCIGVGLTRGKDFIGKSKPAFDMLFTILKLSDETEIRIYDRAKSEESA